MEVTSDIVKELVGFKKPKVAEIECTLFENCDVNCAFCGHDKKATVGMSREEMLAKLKPIAEFLDSKDDDVTMVNLHLVGGELLQDRLIGEGTRHILHDYSVMIMEYAALCEKRGIQPRVYLVSNMLTTKPQIVADWLTFIEETGVHIRLIASYDLAGRPINVQYKSNMKFFRQWITNVNVVVTKQAIKRLIKGDPYFDELYADFEIFMDDFLPDKQSERMIPSDDEYLEYLKLVATKYPKLMPFGEALERLRNGEDNELQFTTFNKINILPDGKVTNYLFERHKPEYFEGVIDYADHANLLWNFIQENQCMSCEYYRSCPLRCPVSWSWKNRERSPGCTNKRFFDWVSKNKV